MINNDQKLKGAWLLCKLICSAFIVLGVISCKNLPKTKSVPTADKGKKFSLQGRAFETHWSYFLADGKKGLNFKAYIFFKDAKTLRMDVLTPVIGNAGINFILKENDLLVRMPFKKEYYRGDFYSKAFFPNFEDFSSGVFFSLLKYPHNKGDFANWKCWQTQFTMFQCQKGTLAVRWEYKNSQLKQFWLMSKTSGSLKVKILKAWQERLQEDKFLLPIKGYKKQDVLVLK